MSFLFSCDKNNLNILVASNNKHLLDSWDVHVVWLTKAGLSWPWLDSRLLADFKSVSSLPGTYSSRGGSSQECKRENSDMGCLYMLSQNGSTVTSTHIPPTKATCCQWHGNIFPTIVETLQISMSMAWYIILTQGRNIGECGNSFYKARIYSKAHILMAWLYLSKRWLAAFISWRSSEDKMR